jgi:VanZ family protein
VLNTLRKLARRAVLVVLVCYWLVIFLGTHLPSRPDEGFQMNDKALHFGAYCGLSFLLGCTLLRRRSWKGFLLVLAIIAAYGVFDEWSQIWVPHRIPDVSDWVADISGGIVGLSMYCLGCAPKSFLTRNPLSTVAQRDAA